MTNTSRKLALVLASALLSARCSGGSDSPTTPTPPTNNPPANAVTVSIVATNGNQSYQPNPIAVTGQQIVFKNDDRVLHHIVMDNGSADFGTLSPGDSGPARTVASGNFHCTIHPSMVGSINGAAAPEPPAGSGDGY